MTGRFLQLTLALDKWRKSPKVRYQMSDTLNSLSTAATSPLFPDGIEKLIARLIEQRGLGGDDAIKNMSVNTFLDEPLNTVGDLMGYFQKHRVEADPVADGLADAIAEWIDDEIDFSAGTTLKSLWATENPPDEFIPDGADALCDKLRNQSVFDDNAVVQSLDSDSFGNIIVVSDLYRELSV